VFSKNNTIPQTFDSGAITNNLITH